MKYLITLLTMILFHTSLQTVHACDCDGLLQKATLQKVTYYQDEAIFTFETSLENQQPALITFSLPAIPPLALIISSDAWSLTELNKKDYAKVLQQEGAALLSENPHECRYVSFLYSMHIYGNLNEYCPSK